MKKLLAIFVFLSAVMAWAGPSFAFAHRGTVPIEVVNFPEIAGLDYPNNGTTSALSGTTTTLTVSPGTYSQNLITRSYRWHTPCASPPCTSLGTGTSITLTASTYVGQAIEVDETVNGLAGSLTTTSYIFGPIETTIPPVITAWESASNPNGQNVGPTSLPVAPANYLECYGPGTYQHAVFPGAVVPPCEPTYTSGSHVWCFDPINGTAGGSGHEGSCWKDIAALGISTSGYSNSPLFGHGRTIAPGDTIYVYPGWNTGGSTPLGVIGQNFNYAYSTSDGTSTGTIIWTWILPDPSATSTPVLFSVSMGNGGNAGAAGFIINGINVENNRGTALNMGGNSTYPVHDILFENMSISGWTGHSTDPRYPSNYPNSGGSSDGLVTSASPVTAGENAAAFTLPASLAANSTVINLATGPQSCQLVNNAQLCIPEGQGSTPAGAIGQFIWTSGYYLGNPATNLTTAATYGMPPGTKVASFSGLSNTTAVYAGTLYSLSPTELLTAYGLTSLTPVAGSPFLTVAAMNAVTGTTSNYAIVEAATTGLAPQAVYIWNGTAWLSIGSTAPSAYSGAVVNPLYMMVNGSTAVTVTGVSATTGGTLTLASPVALTNGSVVTYGANTATVSSTGGGYGTSFALATANTTFSGSTAGTATLVFTNLSTAVTNPRVADYNGSAWVDLGVPKLTLAPCSPTADAGIGCPTSDYPGLTHSATSNIPGCDPYFSTTNTSTGVKTFYGGLVGGACASGSPVAWNGTTTALASTFSLQFTERMQILPVGYWTVADWSSGTGAYFVGAEASAATTVPIEVSSVTSVGNAGTMTLVNPVTLVAGTLIYGSVSGFPGYQSPTIITPGFVVTTGGTGTSFSVAGTLAYSTTPSGNNANAVYPRNILSGITNISLKDSTFRNSQNLVSFDLLTNAVIFNNWFKFASGDAIDNYSDHRTWVIHNYYSDPTIVFAHQDALQVADDGVDSGNVYWYYNNAAVDNEFYQTTDLTNPFPRYMQSITDTDNSYWNQYVANNITDGTTNPISVSGDWNAAIQNTDIGTGVATGIQTKGERRLPNNALLANNVGTDINSYEPQGIIGDGTCSPTTGNNTTVEGNISIPYVAYSGAVSGAPGFLCTAPSGSLVNGTNSPGVYTGSYQWSVVDWAGTPGTSASTLFNSYSPLNNATIPYAQNAFSGTAVSTFQNCIQNSFPATGGCTETSGLGIMNMRPYSGFSGYTGTIPGLTSYRFVENLPQTGNKGDTYIVTGTLYCFGAGQPVACGPNSSGATSCGFSNTNQIVWPPGVYVRARATSSAVCGDGDFTQWTSWANNITPIPVTFNPPIMGAGTALTAWPNGPQPIVNHDGNAWSSPPNAGAY